MPEVTNIQMILIYYLIHIFHKDTAQEDIQKFQHQFKILLLSTVKEYSHYLTILKIIGLLSENQHNTDMDFLNKCKIIQNLNKFEFNSSLSSFLLLKDSIPQYKNINFPKLDSKDNENIYNEKIKNISILLDVINSSLLMHDTNIRFEMFKKYINNKGDKLNAINQVLSSLNKKKLKSLNDNDLMQHIELQIENNSFLQNENKKGLQTISNLRKKIIDY